VSIERVGKVCGSGGGGYRMGLGVGMSGSNIGVGREWVRKVVIHSDWGHSQRTGRCEEDAG